MEEHEQGELQHEGAGDAPALDQCNVFVKYLPPDLDDKEFQRMFKAHGQVVSSKIMIDQATGKSLGYGCALPPPPPTCPLPSGPLFALRPPGTFPISLFCPNSTPF